MADRPYKAVSGKTYSLFGTDTSTELYFRTMRAIAESLLGRCPDQRSLLHVQKEGGVRFKKRSGYTADDTPIAHIRKTLQDALQPYTRAVKEHPDFSEV